MNVIWLRYSPCSCSELLGLGWVPKGTPELPVFVIYQDGLGMKGAFMTLVWKWTSESVIGSVLYPLSMGFSRQEYWGGYPFPSPADLPNPEIEPGSPALQADFFFTIWAAEEAPYKSLKNSSKLSPFTHFTADKTEAQRDKMISIGSDSDILNTILWNNGKEGLFNLSLKSISK